MEMYRERSVHFVSVTISERFEFETERKSRPGRRISGQPEPATASRLIPTPLLLGIGALALAIMRDPRLRALAGPVSRRLIARLGPRGSLPAPSHQPRALPSP